MIGAAREWLLSVVAVTMLLCAAQAMIPEGSIRKVSSFTGGLVLLAALLRPVLGTDLGDLRLDLGDYQAAIEERQRELQGEQDRELETIIAGRAQAYISDKARDLGLEVRVRVFTEPGPEGVPLPAAVEVEGPWSGELAAEIQEALGIGPERQTWKEREDEN